MIDYFWLSFLKELSGIKHRFIFLLPKVRSMNLFALSDCAGDCMLASNGQLCLRFRLGVIGSYICYRSPQMYCMIKCCHDLDS